MKKEYKFTKAKRGAVVLIPAGKTRITIRIDDDVLDWFRAQVDAAGGGSYQALINTFCESGFRVDQSRSRRYFVEFFARSCRLSRRRGASAANLAAGQPGVAADQRPPLRGGRRVTPGPLAAERHDVRHIDEVVAEGNSGLPLRMEPNEGGGESPQARRHIRRGNDGVR